MLLLDFDDSILFEGDNDFVCLNGEIKLFVDLLIYVTKSSKLTFKFSFLAGSLFFFNYYAIWYAKLLEENL